MQKCRSDHHLDKRGQQQKTAYIQYLESDRHKKLLSSILPFIKGDKVLDLGCGSGVFLEMIAGEKQPVRALIGVESSSFLYSYAVQKNIPKATILHQDIFDYRFPFAALDTIIMTSVLHEIVSYKSIAKIGQLFARIYHALTQQGVFLLYDGFKNDHIVVKLEIKNAHKYHLFMEFQQRRKEWSFCRVGSCWITTLTAAFDFIHKCYYEESWQDEINEYYYPLFLETYQLALYSSGFRLLQLSKFPELENIDRIRQDFRLTSLAGEDLLEFPTNCLIQAFK